MGVTCQARRLLCAAVVGLMSVGGVSALASVPSAGASTHKTSATTNVTVELDGAAVPYYAPFFVAEKLGIFRHYGLNVNLIYGEASTIIQNTAVNNVQFGFPDGASTVLGRAQGEPIRVIDTTYQQGIDSILSLKSAGITKPADLKGKTVAVTSLGSADYAELEAVLEGSGMSINDVHVVVVGTSAIVQALESHQVDAIAFSRLRYYTLEAAGFKVNQINEEPFIPEFGNVLITSKGYLSSHRGVVKNFDAALHKAIEFIIHGHVKQAINLAVVDYAPSFNGQQSSLYPIIQNIYVKQLWESQFTRKYGLGYGDPKTWQASIDTLAKYRIIPHKFPVGDLLVEPSSL